EEGTLWLHPFFRRLRAAELCEAFPQPKNTVTFQQAPQHKGGTLSKGSLPYASLSAQDGDCPLFHRGKSRLGYGAGGPAPQISRLPSRARIRVASSANSRWPPTGMP